MQDKPQPPATRTNVIANDRDLRIDEFAETDRSIESSKYNHGVFETRHTQVIRIHERKGIRTNNITFREKEVLELLSNGDSSKIIADKLHISETTAITHRKNLIQKLHVKNTAHLIKVAVLAKIIA